MQQNRLTVMGPPRLIRALIQRQPLVNAAFHHVELLEQLPGRYALQFESVTDPFINLQKLSRQKPGLIFLLDYERRGIKGLAVIALLDRAQALGLLESVSDESGFWEHREVKDLVPEIASWNRMIAAFAGQLKDALGNVKASIMEYRNFEELELAGQEQLPPGMQELTKLIQQVAKQP